VTFVPGHFIYRDAVENEPAEPSAFFQTLLTLSILAEKCPDYWEEYQEKDDFVTDRARLECFLNV
jgi:hypothetical protein